jgi:hypothetical protein
LLLLHTKTGNFFKITTRQIQTNKQRTSYNNSSSSSLYKTNSVHKKKPCYFFVASEAVKAKKECDQIAAI